MYQEHYLSILCIHVKVQLFGRSWPAAYARKMIPFSSWMLSVVVTLCVDTYSCVYYALGGK